MKGFFVFAASVLAMTLCVYGTASAASLVEGNAKAGKAKAGTCAGCHGADGNSASGQFPKLAGQHASYIVEQLKLFKSGKRKNAIMKGMASGLSEQDMKDLAVYFSQQKTTLGVADPKLVERGRELFRGGDAEAGIPACSGCHGPTGMGNPAADYPRISSQQTQYIIAQLTAYRDGKRGNYPKGTIMQGVASKLTDEDIRSLASYVSGLHEAKPPIIAVGQK